ncbi:hypothetical protein [Sphingobacterium multivorum]|uniref:hypothetical protein n=1 Tax=Sphingobacterium multivorum TaxID=28454 RepID=UPI0028A9B453|nr:hypothetical protein [Sphingobacterium multivorum]
MECLDKIIGISNTDCECATQDIQPEDRVSKSGIFMDEVEGGLKLSSIEKIDCQDFLTKSRNARKRATDQFIESILAQYATDGGFTQKFEKFDGRIGKTEHLRTLSYLPKYAGLKLKPLLIRGSSIKISSIGLIWGSETTVSLSIYKCYGKGYDLDLIKTIEIQTLANIQSLHTLDELLELPLADDRNLPIQYYFLYDTSSSGFPRDNKATCTCGGMERILKTYLSLGGVQADSMDGINLSNEYVQANGIYLNAKIDCTSKAAICNLLALDESNTIAHAIAYKAQEFLIEDVMSSGRVNRFTMLSNEHMWGKRNHFRKEFDNRIMWLSQTYPYIKINDCVECESGNVMYKGLIR